MGDSRQGMSEHLPAEDEYRDATQRSVGPPRRPPPDLDPRSFVERYRGSEWQPAASDLQAAPKQAGGRTKWPLILGVVLVAGALVVGGMYAWLGSKKPTGLGAFRDSTPAPVQVYVVPGASTTPAGSGGAPTLSPTQAPQPWLADSLHPAARFIAQMAAPDLSFHVRADVLVAAAGDLGSLDYVMDVAGPDYAVELRYLSPTSELAVDMVVKDGDYYARDDGGAWMHGQGAPPPGNPFGEVRDASYSQLEYVGREAVDGKLLHHVRLPVFRWPGPADRALSIVRAPSVFKWDVWIDAEGRPRMAAATFDVTTRSSGRDVPVTLDFGYTISKFGKTISIKVPVD